MLLRMPLGAASFQEYLKSLGGTLALPSTFSDMASADTVPVEYSKWFHGFSLSTVLFITILPLFFKQVLAFRCFGRRALQCMHMFPGTGGLLCMIHRVGMYVMQTKLVVLTCLLVTHPNFTLWLEDTRVIVKHWKLKVNHRFFFQSYTLG